MSIVLGVVGSKRRMPGCEMERGSDENGTISAKGALAGRPSMTQVAPLSSYLFVHILPAS
jgi:hypothetical protein